MGQQRQQQHRHMQVVVNLTIRPAETSPLYVHENRSRGRLCQPMSKREFNYCLCDVFTETAFQGNQLAVFLDAAGLSDAEMQATAREMNLSETTFILRRETAVEREQGVRVRIFTTQEELPFAGHPTLGTSATVRRELAEYADAEMILLNLNAGRVPVAFAPERNAAGKNYGDMTQPDPTFGSEHKIHEIAPLLGLEEVDCLET